MAKKQKLPSIKVGRESRAGWAICDAFGSADGHQQCDRETVKVSRWDLPTGHHMGDML